jgi:hypothetical protein
MKTPLGSVPQKQQVGIPNYHAQKAINRARNAVDVWPTVEYIKSLPVGHPERNHFEQDGRTGWQKYMDSLETQKTA